MTTTDKTAKTLARREAVEKDRADFMPMARQQLRGFTGAVNKSSVQ
jgi:hypothetical protein